MTATLENFRGLFPEFADPVATDVQVNFALELAAEQHKCSDNAKLYLAAHTIQLWINEGVGGDGTTETQGSGFAVRQKVGDLEAQYTAPKNTDDAYYMTTPYGRQYLALRNAANRKFAPRVR